MSGFHCDVQLPTMVNHWFECSVNSTCVPSNIMACWIWLNWSVLNVLSLCRDGFAVADSCGVNGMCCCKSKGFWGKNSCKWWSEDSVSLLWIMVGSMGSRDMPWKRCRSWQKSLPFLSTCIGVLPGKVLSLYFLLLIRAQGSWTQARKHNSNVSSTNLVQLKFFSFQFGLKSQRSAVISTAKCISPCLLLQACQSLLLQWKPC